MHNNDNSKYYINKGFTLAEVLVTLGIIGVVAAMTLPAVINNTKNKQLEAEFKKSYSTLSQVTQTVYLEDFGGQLPINSNSSNFNTIVNTFMKYYNSAERCSGARSVKGCPHGVGFGGDAACNFMKQTYTAYNSGKSGICHGNDAMFKTIDGSSIYFDYANVGESTYGSIDIAIDVNGWDKKPNKWGHDMFLFQLKSNGRLLPMGADNTNFPAKTYCSDTSKRGDNGLGCTIKAVTDKNYFKNLPK